MGNKVSVFSIDSFLGSSKIDVLFKYIVQNQINDLVNVIKTHGKSIDLVNLSDEYDRSLLMVRLFTE